MNRWEDWEGYQGERREELDERSTPQRKTDMVEVGSDIKGLKELAKNSDKLKKSFRRYHLRTALRNAAQPVRRRARAKVPRDSGDLRKAIAINAKVDRKGEGFADVGFRKDQGFLRGFRRAWYINPAGTTLPAASPGGS